MNVARKHQLIAAFGLKFFRQIDLFGLNQALTDLPTLSEREGVRHRAADKNFITDPKKILDYHDLVGDLRAAKNRDEGTLRIANRVRKILNFLLDKETANARFALHSHRNGNHRSVRSVASSKRVIDVNVGKRSQLSGKFFVPLLFAGLESEVFKNHDRTGGQSGNLRLRVVAYGVRCKGNVHTGKQLSKTISGGFQSELRIRSVLRTSKMTH